MVRAMSSVLAAALASLQSDSSRHLMATRYCSSCLRDKPDEARRCKPCDSIDLISPLCDSSRRTGDFVAMLVANSICQFDTGEAPAYLAKRARDIDASNSSSHNCSGGQACGLCETVANFQKGVTSAILKAKHLQLEDFKQPSKRGEHVSEDVAAEVVPSRTFASSCYGRVKVQCGNHNTMLTFCFFKPRIKLTAHQINFQHFSLKLCPTKPDTCCTLHLRNSISTSLDKSHHLDSSNSQYGIKLQDFLG